MMNLWRWLQSKTTENHRLDQFVVSLILFGCTLWNVHVWKAFVCIFGNFRRDSKQKMRMFSSILMETITPFTWRWTDIWITFPSKNNNHTKSFRCKSRLTALASFIIIYKFTITFLDRFRFHYYCSCSSMLHCLRYVSHHPNESDARKRIRKRENAI